MEKLMRALLVWIALNTTYPAVSTLPEVQYRSSEELRQMLFCETKTSLGETCKVSELPDIEILALFDRDARVMHLRNGFDESNPDDRGTLVHELTHYLQALDRRFDHVCRGVLERDAYVLEDRWRVEQGLEPLPTNAAKIMAQQCIPGPT